MVVHAKWFTLERLSILNHHLRPDGSDNRVTRLCLTRDLTILRRRIIHDRLLDLPATLFRRQMTTIDVHRLVEVRRDRSGSRTSRPLISFGALAFCRFSTNGAGRFPRPQPDHNAVDAGADQAACFRLAIFAIVALLAPVAAWMVL